MRLLLLIATVLALVVLPSCGGERSAERPDRAKHPPATEPETVTVFYATDRAVLEPDTAAYLDKFFWAGVVFFGGLLVLCRLGRMIRRTYRGRLKVLWFVFSDIGGCHPVLHELNMDLGDATDATCLHNFLRLPDHRKTGHHIGNTE